MNLEGRLRFYLSNEEIFKIYFGDFDLKTKYVSPFPFRNDPRPSFMFKDVGTGGKQFIIWNDFGIPDAEYKDAIGYIMQYFGLSRDEAVAKIWNEVILDRSVDIPKVVVKGGIKIPYTPLIKDITDLEMAYWDRLMFSKNMLKFFNVSVLRLLLKFNREVWRYSDDNPTYHYSFGTDSFKCYRPLDPRKDKFRGQNNGDKLEGYSQLPQTWDHLVISSSLKDTMTLRHIGIISVNPSSENSFNVLLSKADELNSRFKNIYVLYDNDSAGRNATIEITNRTGWGELLLPEKGGKDPSDWVVNDGGYRNLDSFFGSKFKRYEMDF